MNTEVFSVAYIHNLYGIYSDEKFVKLSDYDFLRKENKDLKEQIEELQLNLRSRNDLVEDLIMQIEKMKNFYNCSHSSRALCPNEHKCNGCKDWELAE